jgi:predicted nucleic acid-binding protein
MNNYVLDASALLRYTDNQAGAGRVEALLLKAAKGQVSLFMSAVNWGEIVTVIMRRHGPAKARSILAALRSLSVHFVDADVQACEAAGAFRYDYSLPYADSFAASTLLQMRSEGHDGILVTADLKDFGKLPKNLLKIEFLPEK